MRERFTNDTGIWVFGFGSLMWNPGFSYLKKTEATVWGYHRSLCVYSKRYRGTPEKPGLVLGLDRGGSCRGRAFQVAPSDRGAVIKYLYDREMSHDVYAPSVLDARCGSGRKIKVLAFVVRRNHELYTGCLPLEKTAQYVSQGFGPRGSSFEYLENTVQQLEEMGVRSGTLHQIFKATCKICAE